MFWNESVIKGYTIEASDGALGAVHDILFDDASWRARWLVVDTGNWLPGRKVLIPLAALEKPDSVLQSFPVKLSKQQVKDSPDINTDMSVSQQMETNVYRYYGCDPFGGYFAFPAGSLMAAPSDAPVAGREVRTDTGAPAPPDESADRPLRGSE